MQWKHVCGHDAEPVQWWAGVLHHRPVRLCPVRDLLICLARFEEVLLAMEKNSIPNLLYGLMYIFIHWAQRLLVMFVAKTSRYKLRFLNHLLKRSLKGSQCVQDAAPRDPCNR